MIIIFIFLLFVKSSDSGLKNIILRENENIKDQYFKYIISNEFESIYSKAIEIYISLIEDYENIKRINKDEYRESYSDLFGYSKNYFINKNYNDSEILVNKYCYDDICLIKV